MLRVYPSSKVKHAPMWSQLQKETSHIFFNARWLKRAEHGETMEGADFRELWHECQEDVKNADAFLLYAEDDDHLRGALVEVGFALAHGVRVIVVTPVEDPITLLGSWLWAGGVMRVRTMEEAMKELYLMTEKGRKEEQERRWFEIQKVENEEKKKRKLRPFRKEERECSCGGSGSACECE